MRGSSKIVYPPVTDTGWVNDAIRDYVKQDSHLIHIVGPEDVAEVIVFPCSDQGRLITANVVHFMIRKFQQSDIDQVISIWLEASIKAHDFVDISSYFCFPGFPRNRHRHATYEKS